MNETKQRVKGMGERIEGKVREVGGAVTGDTSEEVAGKMEQVKGKARQKVANISDAVKGNRRI